MTAHKALRVICEGKRSVPAAGAPTSGAVPVQALPPPATKESYRKLGSLPASPQVSGVMARVSDKTQGNDY